MPAGSVSVESLAWSARAALDELARDVETLEVACSWAYESVGCETTSAAAHAFLDGTAPRLLARLEGGDVHAGENLLVAAVNIRTAVLDVAHDVDATVTPGALLARFHDEVVATTGRDVLALGEKTVSILPWAIGAGVAIGLAGWLLSLRR